MGAMFSLKVTLSAAGSKAAAASKDTTSLVVIDSHPYRLTVVDSLGYNCRCSRLRCQEGIQSMPKPSDLLQGTVDLLILRTLAREPLHGWAISKRIQQV